MQSSFGWNHSICCFFVSFQISGSFLMIVNRVDYLFLTLCELFVFGHAGDILKKQISMLTEALMRCPWHFCNREFRLGILVFMANARKSLVFILDYEKAKAVQAGRLLKSIRFYSEIRLLSDFDSCFFPLYASSEDFLNPPPTMSSSIGEW